MITIRLNTSAENRFAKCAQKKKKKKKNLLEQKFEIWI